MSEIGTSLRAARGLTRRRRRDAEHRFLAEGAPAVREALAYGTVRALFGTPEALAAFPDPGVPVRTATARDLATLSETVTPQGLVAVCDVLDVGLAAALAARPALVVVCHEIRDPGNAGTVLRTADAAGAGAVVFTDASVDPYNGKCVRSSAGSLFHLPVVRGVPAGTALDACRAAGLQVLAATGAGEVDLLTEDADAVLARPTAWLFGNEAHGLPAALAAAADARVRIPIFGRAESLNLAAAAAICLYASARAHPRPRS